jgi:hypothetical protein
MCRIFQCALLGLLLTVTLASAEPAKSSPAASPLALNPASQAVFQTIICPLGQTTCPCIPDFSICSDQDTSVSFVKQKGSGVCVYQCQFTETCYDSTGCSTGHTTTFGSFRVRSAAGQYPIGGCPAADISFCQNMAVDP